MELYFSRITCLTHEPSNVGSLVKTARNVPLHQERITTSPVFLGLAGLCKASQGNRGVSVWQVKFFISRLVVVHAVFHATVKELVSIFYKLRYSQVCWINLHERWKLYSKIPSLRPPTIKPTPVLKCLDYIFLHTR